MKEAAFYNRQDDGTVVCELCPHNCRIADGKRGICRVRENQSGTLVALTYGKVCSTAVDPIEKKPLYHFFPGQPILSIGSWGCNFACDFCQNWSIAQQEVPTQSVTPEQLVTLARDKGSIGIAYTYNEPTIAWEFVYDCSVAMHEAGLKNVLVTNGFINPEPLQKLLPFVDAMNIDIKAFHEGFYKERCKGRLAPVLETVKTAAAACHVEVTTLVIPGKNDDLEELEQLACWLKDNCGADLPAHLSAYSPRYRLQAEPTPVATLLEAQQRFQKHLHHVYLGNVMSRAGADTICPNCSAPVVKRSGYHTDTSGMNENGSCAKCGMPCLRN